MTIVTSVFEMPATCEDTDSWTCAVVYDTTGNEDLAHAAEWVIGKPAAIVGLLVLAWLVRWIAHRLIDRVVARARSGVRLGRFGTGTGLPGSDRRAARAQSLGSLLRSIATGVIYGIVFVLVLDQLGVNIAPIIASAGVVGLAIGFGAQSLVKDFLAGISMLLEDQYGIGDIVDLGDAIGTVEAVGLRVTRVRDVEGTVWYVRNGEVVRVGNHSQEWARTVLDIEVGYGADLTRVRRILTEAADELCADPEFADRIVAEPEVWGVQSMDANGVAMRIVLKTLPLQQWAVARELRERIRTRLDAEGIALPYPQRAWHDAPE